MKEHQGDAEAALAALDRIERKCLQKDAPKVWGLSCLPEAFEPDEPDAARRVMHR